MAKIKDIPKIDRPRERFLQNDFNELTKELEKNEKNNFFIRYINKESHSDPINISDSKEIDPQIFKEAFKKIFKDSGYEAHYNQMMNLNNTNPINLERV